MAQWMETINALEATSREVPEHFSGRSVDVAIQIVLLRALDDSTARRDYHQAQVTQIESRLALYGHKAEADEPEPNDVG